MEGKRRFWRFATVAEATQMHFRLSSRSAYGLVSGRRHQGELSRKDLQLRWGHEIEMFRGHAQPIRDWAQMIRDKADRSPESPNAEANPETDQKTNGNAVVDTCSVKSEIDERKITIRVRIDRREVWRIPAQDSGRRLMEHLDATIGWATSVD
jgi:hypothetical protein